MAVKSIVKIAISLVIIAATVLIVLNRQFIVDQIRVWQFSPDPQIAVMSDRAGLSDKGEFYFYASAPQLNTASEFNVNCTQQEAGSAILGCYANQSIYIYDVPEKQLDGIEEVTAAHEMLHAVWERMDATRREDITLLLEAEYVTLKDDSLEERMAYYDRTEPGERANELHSILATEYSGLSQELEEHYAQYFSDRSLVIALHDEYQSVFDDLQRQSEKLAAEMTTLKSTIDTNIARYEAEYAAINSSITVLEARQPQVDLTSPFEVSQFNNQRQTLLNRISALESLQATIAADTDLYNNKVTAYNTLIVTNNSLVTSLDSTLAPTPQL